MIGITGAEQPFVQAQRAQRYQLRSALENQLGTENAATLMAHLPPVGWADVATKHDLHALEDRLGLRLTAEIVDLRGELRTEIADVRTEIADVRTEIADVRTEIHKTARAMTFAIVAATASIVGTTAALTSLFG